MTMMASVLALAATGALAQNAGDRVLAKWGGDGLFYPGRVQQVEDKNYVVAFDDGDIATVRKADLREVDWKPGSRLQCNWKNQGRYYPGRVEEMKGESIVFLYDDGYRETITISRCRSN